MMPDYQTIMLPLLRLGASGERKLAEAVKQLQDDFGLSEDERAEVLSSGVRKFANRVSWAKTYLLKAHLIKSTRRAILR